MRLGPTPPLVSEELEKPVPEAWLYQTADYRREVLLSKMHDAQLEHYRSAGRHIYESDLFNIGALNRFAQDAVQAEQDLIVPLIEKCAEHLNRYINERKDDSKLVHDASDALDVLRLFVIRGRS
jgi:hypothetical protein